MTVVGVLGDQRNLLLAAAVAASLVFDAAALSKTRRWSSGEIVPDLFMHPPVASPRIDVVQPDASTFAVQQDDPPTFAVMARLYNAELPYLVSFVQHYTLIGSRTFYLLNNKFEQHEELRSFLEGMNMTEVRFVLKSYRNASEEFPTPSTVVKDSELLVSIKETFVINVDIDEYWVLPNNMNLGKYVAAFPGDCYFMHWLEVPSDSFSDGPHPPYVGHTGHRGKWMARTAKLLDMRLSEPLLVVPHTVVGDSYQHRPEVVGTLIHFWGRNFKDVATKAYSQTGVLKSAGFESSRNDVNNGRLPERLKLLAFLVIQNEPANGTDMCSPPHCWVVDPGKDLLQIDAVLQARLAGEALRVPQETVDEEIGKVLGLYLHYKTYLRNLLATGAYPEGYPDAATLNDVGMWLEDKEPSAEDLT